jgi:hypothetical protein
MISINKRLMRIYHEIKLEHYKKQKQEHDLNLKTKMSKCMANVSSQKTINNGIHIASTNLYRKTFPNFN